MRMGCTRCAWCTGECARTYARSGGKASRFASLARAVGEQSHISPGAPVLRVCDLQLSRLPVCFSVIE